MSLILRVAAKAITQEQLTLWMSKLRKKADSSLSVKQIISVLEHLGGWKVEPVIGLDPFDRGVLQTFLEKRQEYVQQRWAEAKLLEVSALPSSPVKGKKYLMDVSEIHQVWGPSHPDVLGFTFKEWWGSPALRFTSPTGKVFDFIQPLGKDLYKIPPGWGGLTGWLYKETDLIDQVSKKLDMPTPDEEKANKAPRTRDNTGSCPCCFGNYKLKSRSNAPPEVVLHGFKRPRWGEGVVGSCMGVGFPPYELSPEGTEHLVKKLKNRIDDLESLVRDLRSGRTTVIYRKKDEIRKDAVPEAEWESLVKKSIDNMEGDIDFVSRDLKIATKLVNTWELRELPFEGGKHVTFWKL